MYSASAPGKIILFGEHAVVYGRPAIAVPVHDLRAQAVITRLDDAEPNSILIEASDIQISARIEDLGEEDLLRQSVQLILDTLEVNTFPSFELRISSEIPIASGLGSSAAVNVAMLRALALFFERELSLEFQSKLTYQIERLYHGTPSGIDNTVVTYEKPIFFRRGEDPQVIEPGDSMTFLIADTGIASPTGEVVSGVRERWMEEESYYEALFDQISELSLLAKRAISAGHIPVLGPLMNQNQVLLKALGVSSPEIESLVRSAQETGAFGAKLSGAGQGGNVIALIEPSLVGAVTRALQDAGAKHVFRTSASP